MIRSRRWSIAVATTLAVVALAGALAFQQRALQGVRDDVQDVTEENRELRAELRSLSDATTELETGIAAVAEVVNADSATAGTLSDRVRTVETDLADLDRTLFGTFGRSAFETDVIGDLESQVEDVWSTVAEAENCLDSIQRWINSTYGSYLYC